MMELSTFQAPWPLEIDRLLESDKWTLDDDVCWWSFFAELDFIFNIVIIVLLYQNILSVCLSVTQHVAALRMLYLLPYLLLYLLSI